MIKRPLFLRVQFNIPSSAGVGDNVEGASIHKKFSTASVLTAATDRVDQWFDDTICVPAVVGLPEGVEPMKPEPGDYGYSGMHDHGPLPTLKEGGRFAQLISLVNEGKKASDKYLTEVIREGKVCDTEQKDNQSFHGRKRKLNNNSEESLL